MECHVLQNWLQCVGDACRSGGGKRLNFHVPREVINYQQVDYAMELKEVRGDLLPWVTWEG